MAEATTMSRQDFIELIIETEFPSVLIEDIEFLSRKVQQGLSFEASLQALIACVEQIGPEEKSVLAIACERLCELEKLTDDAIQSAAGAIKLNAKAKEKARLLLEDQKLFHSPAMAADFKHYRLLAYWDMHEAACLLLGKDPRCLQRTFLLNAAGGSPFAARFRELTGFLTRAAELGLIGGKRRIEPSRLVPWALSQGIDVPEALATTFRQPDTELRQDLNADDLQPSRAAPSGSSTSMNTPMSPAELENKVLKATLRKERSANTTWRKTTSLIIHGLLHANLGGGPRNERASVTKAVGFLHQILRRNLDENTVRSRMKEIDEMIDELQREIDQAGKEDRAATQRN
jgi:hypothetical protein